MKLYVGNLSFETSEADLRALFDQFGTVTEISIINDRMTGRPRGFAFVTMSNVAEGRAAISGLQGKEFSGRPLIVNEARSEERSSQRTLVTSTALELIPFLPEQ